MKVDLDTKPPQDTLLLTAQSLPEAAALASVSRATLREPSRVKVFGDQTVMMMVALSPRAVVVQPFGMGSLEAADLLAVAVDAALSGGTIEGAAAGDVMSALRSYKRARGMS